MTLPIEVRITLVARSHIEDILQYTLTQWGVEQTERYEESLYAAFHVIQDNPEIGRQVGMEQRGVRVYAMRHHLVYYRIEPGAVVILRLINPRQRR